LTTLLRYALTAVGIFVGSQVLAQTPSIFPDQLKLASPPSAASTVLGVDASKVSSPTDLSALGLGIINSFDAAGKLKSGFAFSASLGGLNLTSVRTWSQYQNSSSKRRDFNTRLSFAAVRGSGSDDPSARLGFGLSIPIVNETDWRAEFASKNIDRIRATSSANRSDFDATLLAVDNLLGDTAQNQANLAPSELRPYPDQAALERARAKLAGLPDSSSTTVTVRIADLDRRLDKAVRDRPNANIPTLVKDFNAFVADFDAGKLGFTFLNVQAYEKLVKKLDELSWNRRKIDFALAATMFAADASKDSFKSDGTFAWLTYAAPVGLGQVTMAGRYFDKDRKWDKDAKAYRILTGYEIGGRFKTSSLSSAFFAEYQYTEGKQSGKKYFDRIIQGGYEVQVGSNQWFQISIGGATGAGLSGGTILGLNYSVNIGGSPSLVKK